MSFQIQENPDCKTPTPENMLEVTPENNFNNLFMERIFTNKERKYFCAWCASKTSDLRDYMFNTIVENDISKTTHSLGKQYGTHPETNKKVEGQNCYALNLVEEYSNYYFVLAMENSDKEGYVTEKILNAFYSGAIPIFYGDRSVLEYFNKDAFIYVNDFLLIYGRLFVR